MLRLGISLLILWAGLFLVGGVLQDHGLVILGICGPSSIGLLFLSITALSLLAGISLTAVGSIRWLVRRFR